MIARIIIPIIVCTVLPYLWIDRRYIRSRGKKLRVLFWLPALIVLAYSIYLALQRNFIPDNPVLEDIWFLVMAFFAVPQFVFAVCGGIGYGCMRLLRDRLHWGKIHSRRNLGKLVGLVLAVVACVTFLYGFTYGFRKMSVKRITIYVPDLPKSFEGYRIVQFTDIHFGSYYGWRGDLPQRDVDTINALKPDMICFTGDVQNVQPSDFKQYIALMRQLKAKDGVYSVLGNHDYTYYVDVSPEEAVNLEAQVKKQEREMGWHLLNNEQAVIRRGNDSIYVVGTENYEKPAHTHIAKALYGIKKGNFVLMLQHIPKQWKETWPSTINEMHGSKDTVLVAPQLTLSGHTHGGQISVLGLRPSMFTPFDYGLYEHEGCQLYTSSGLGGTIPIRIGATAEIVEITLKRK